MTAKATSDPSLTAPITPADLDELEKEHAMSIGFDKYGIYGAVFRESCGIQGLALIAAARERDVLHLIVHDIKRHLETCENGLGRFLRDRIKMFEESAKRDDQEEDSQEKPAPSTNEHHFHYRNTGD